MANNIDRREIDRVLESRRKQREAKACYPCRQRKVKCDHANPCRTCRRRNHPEICAYDVEPPAHRTVQHARQQTNASSSNSATTTAQPTQAPSQPPAFALDPQSRLERDNSREGAGSTYIYSGDNSVVSILRNRTHDNGSMAQEVGSVLGLQNTYNSYPFMDLKTAEDRWNELLRITPQRTEVLRFFQFYRQSSHPFNPILVDVERFELDICTYLNAYAAGEFRNASSISERWLTDGPVGLISLILATLSSGAHYSDLEHLQRSEICQDLARRSFQALRLSNFLFRPSLNTIQTLLILGTSLRDNGQSDASWALLGTTVRLAQTLGLHTEKSIAHLPDNVQSKARRLWSSVVWQDSLLSLSYDRVPIVSTKGWSLDSTIFSRCDLSYTEVMHYLCRLGIEITTNEDRETQEITHWLGMLYSLDDIYQRAQPHLRSRDNCKSLQQNLEHLALKMHISFGISILTRPALKQCQVRDPPYDILRIRAKGSLLDASKAFLDFQALSVVPLRSWSMVHTVLSSTLLLCIWEETRNDVESRDLQQRVIEVFSAAGSVGTMRNSASENGQWLSERHIRALITLRNAVRSVVDQTREDGNPSENHLPSETAFPMFELPPGLPEDLNQIGASPISYLDSIMNNP
ncbi:hypothetical protein FE257_007220 [Aspergillus nanangensis]|uniref:Zn(2)-C6 fungal-type domain-containing protein n=1 Tax=Aspergillus nanangensis TaxID=2582783 RepID=A0AAD4GUC4_ASPNN|nr:hypothetical protein FE257_007220 [Aspergillus nanangensis]